MTLFAIGDIHGCWTALQTLLQSAPIGPNDQIVTLGDYVDRGPESCAVVEWVMARHAQGTLVPLRGNHEIMMLAALNNMMPMRLWLQFGGRQALDSYAPNRAGGKPEDVPIEQIRFLSENLLPYYETDRFVFVHATIDRRRPLDRQSEESLYWDRFRSQKPLPSGKIVVCGHTAQKSGLPANAGFAVCLDTWAYGKGWLTCMNMETGAYWQANQAGEFRSATMDLN